MGNDIAGRNPVPRKNAVTEFDHGGDLRIRKGAIAELVPGIDDLDPDRARVDVRLAAPVRNTRMPGAFVLFDMREDGSVLVHRVVRTHARGRIGKALHGSLAALHACIVHQQDVGHALANAVIEVGRRPLDEAQHQRPTFSVALARAISSPASFRNSASANAIDLPRWRTQPSPI